MATNWSTARALSHWSWFPIEIKRGSFQFVEHIALKSHLENSFPITTANQFSPKAKASLVHIKPKPITQTEQEKLPRQFPHVSHLGASSLSFSSSSSKRNPISSVVTNNMSERQRRDALRANGNPFNQPYVFQHFVCTAQTDAQRCAMMGDKMEHKLGNNSSCGSHPHPTVRTPRYPLRGVAPAVRRTFRIALIESLFRCILTRNSSDNWRVRGWWELVDMQPRKGVMLAHTVENLSKEKNVFCYWHVLHSHTSFSSSLPFAATKKNNNDVRYARFPIEGGSRGMVSWKFVRLWGRFQWCHGKIKADWLLI